MKRAPRSRQRHDLYAKYHDYDSEISDLLGECGVEVVSLSELAGKKPYGLQHVQAAVRAREELASLSADYIKAEWEVIKSALNSAKAEWT